MLGLGRKLRGSGLCIVCRLVSGVSCRAGVVMGDIEGR